MQCTAEHIPIPSAIHCSFLKSNQAFPFPFPFPGLSCPSFLWALFSVLCIGQYHLYKYSLPPHDPPLHKSFPVRLSRNLPGPQGTEFPALLGILLPSLLLLTRTADVVWIFLRSGHRDLRYRLDCAEIRSCLCQVTKKICFCYPDLGQGLQQGHQPGSGNSFLQLLFHPVKPDLHLHLPSVTETIDLPMPGLLTQLHEASLAPETSFCVGKYMSIIPGWDPQCWQQAVCSQPRWLIEQV